MTAHRFISVALLLGAYVTSAQASDWSWSERPFMRLRAPPTEPAFEWPPDKVARRSYGELIVWDRPERTATRTPGVEVLRGPRGQR